MSDQSLILFPCNSSHRLADYDALLNFLREIGLIGGPSKHQWPNEFEQGFAFISLIEFRGHHMVVELTPDANGNLKQSSASESHSFCTIQFEPEKSEPHVLASSLTKAPRCPSCNFCEEEWPDLLGKWWDASSCFQTFIYQCPQCQGSFELNDLNWDHCCGFAWQTIKIQGVRPGEAKPSQKLANHLRDFTGADWTYCYYWL